MLNADQCNWKTVRFEVPIAVIMKRTIFWDVMLCGVVYQRLEKPQEDYIPSQRIRWYFSTDRLLL